MQLWPIMDGIAHEAAVDEIERLVVRPVVLHIIHFETDVWGHPETGRESEYCKSGSALLGVFQRHTNEVGWG